MRGSAQGVNALNTFKSRFRSPEAASLYQVRGPKSVRVPSDQKTWKIFLHSPPAADLAFATTEKHRKISAPTRPDTEKHSAACLNFHCQRSAKCAIFRENFREPG